MDVTPTEFLKRASGTAEYFGFVPAHSFKKNQVCKRCKDKISNSASANDRKLDNLHGLLTAGMNAYADNRMQALEEPVLFYSPEQVPRSGEAAISLQVFGVEKSIAEAILIQTSRALMQDLGYDDHTVRINSLGDRDSTTRYTRELSNYLKKRLDDMPVVARELMKSHAFDALMHMVEKEHELAYRSPNPLEYLSDPSRKHFRDIIEYLEMSETPYEIDPKLIGHYQCYSEALFALDLHDNNGKRVQDPDIYVRGGRYNEFTFRHTKQHIPAAGAVIVLRNKKAPTRTPRAEKRSDPSVYVVQLGFGPKITSLMLVDKLRTENIPVYQDLACDSLSVQLRDAEKRNVKYTVIIGQKEHVEGTVILRDMEARSQETVPQSSLISHLKRTHKVAV